MSFRQFMQRFGSRKPAKANAEVDFRAIAESSADVILQVGLDGVAHYASSASFRLFGYQPAEMVGRTAADFVHHDDVGRIQSAFARYRSGASEGETVEFRMRKKDGSLVWVEERAHVIRDRQAAQPLAMVILLRDISDRKRLEQKLEALANTDGLTGLLNRRAFDEALEREWRFTLQNGREVSLLLIDIDHFKAFNDEYGHLAGDDCLRTVAAAAAGAARDGVDLSARYGGEELAVIMPNTSATAARDVAERIRSTVVSLAIPHVASPTGLLTVSIGVATALARVGGAMRMPEALLASADGALYRAKHAGRNVVSAALLIAPDAGNRTLPS
jgi:diguanylate cyclase (GGDEF)-like protein/PAS domain S-box-containing protein